MAAYQLMFFNANLSQPNIFNLFFPLVAFLDTNGEDVSALPHVFGAFNFG